MYRNFNIFSWPENDPSISTEIDLEFLARDAIAVNIGAASDTLLEALTGWRSLRRVNVLPDAQLGDSGLARLSDLPSLMELNLNFCHDVSIAGLAELRRCKHLRKLDLTACYHFGDDSLKAVGDFRDLHVLSVHCLDLISDQGFSWLVRLPFLGALDIRGCTGITDAAITEIAKCSSLSTLCLPEIATITDDALLLLAVETVMLRNLSLSSMGYITDKGLEYLARSQLEHLVLFDCKNISDQGVYALSHVRSLRVLELHYMSISLRTIEHLKHNNPDLEIVHIPKTAHSPPGGH